MWSSSTTLNVWPQVLSGVFIGMGIMGNFFLSVSYLVDVYLVNANSAVAANMFLRAFFGGVAFPLYAKPFYKRCGVKWATGFVCFCWPLRWFRFQFCLSRFEGKQTQGWME